MSRFEDQLTKQIIGQGHILEDANPMPIPFRQTPTVVGAHSSGAPIYPTVPVDNVPFPK